MENHKYKSALGDNESRPGRDMRLQCTENFATVAHNLITMSYCRRCPAATFVWVFGHVIRHFLFPESTRAAFAGNGLALRRFLKSVPQETIFFLQNLDYMILGLFLSFSLLFKVLNNFP